MKYTFTGIVSTLVLTVGISANANAGVITGGDLLTGTDADQLETWLGVGDQDFTNIFDGTAGATASSWHTAVDGQGPTISIYDVTYDNQQFLIGGYRSVDVTSTSGWVSDASAIIFNLTTDVMLDNDNSNWTSGDFGLYDNSNYFPTFGGGHDLHGGTGTIGGGDEYAYGGWSYGDGSSACFGNGTSLFGSCTVDHFAVNGLETFTLSAATVPEPATLVLLGLGLAGMGVARRRKSTQQAQR